MDETLLPPSPNWFQVSGFAVSKDGWLVYGGPSKSLCVLQPHECNSDLIVKANQSYQAHVINWAHTEKIVSVDIFPGWLEKKCFLAGSADGCVKQWIIEKETESCNIKSTHCHEAHSQEKEEVIGVGYSSDMTAISVGCFGNVVKWDLNSNVVKTYRNFLKLFKPTSMSCSPHISLNVAIGTRQGVVFVLDLNGEGKVLYKVRSQDDEVTNVSWCPQYEVTISKKYVEPVKKFNIHDRIDRIRNEDDIEDVKPAEVEQTDMQKNALEESGIEKSLPEDSFDVSNTTVVEEDDVFDIYKDHEADEFGHKKFQPTEVKVKVTEECEDSFDFLGECAKLKEDILKKNNKVEPSIESLVTAIENVHILNNDATKDVSDKNAAKSDDVSSKHIHKHLLATIGKSGHIKIWSKAGKLVSSCLVATSNKNKGLKSPNWGNILWHRPNCILIADSRSQLLQCNPLIVDCKNKLEWKTVHSLHKRGLYCIASNAPRVVTTNNTSHQKDYVWTVAQDRNIICYDLINLKTVAVHSTCGGFVYMVKQCPYDARKVAACVGDGAIRIWESDILDEDDDETALSAGTVTSHWQRVQGKVLSIAWHPTRENTIAFGTAEARVGVIETGGGRERPASVLTPSLTGGVYSLSWRDDGGLYACAGGALVLYPTTKSDVEPEQVLIEVEGKAWPLSVVQWGASSMAVGGVNGGVAIVTPQSPHAVLAVSYPFSKCIHSMEWHPLQTSNSSEESKYKNLLAVCSLDKQHTIALLQYVENEDGTKSLQQFSTLVGHKLPVLQLSWNPHIDGLLMSTSQDGTVRVWEVASGACVSVFANHAGGGAALGCSWGASPLAPRRALSSGADCCLRVWDSLRHPAHAYDETKLKIKKERKKAKSSNQKQKEVCSEPTDQTEENMAAQNTAKDCAPKKFLIPTIRRHLLPCKPQLIKEMLKRYVKKRETTNGDDDDDDDKADDDERVASGDESQLDSDCLKMFGSTREINELLDMELNDHEERNNPEAWIVLSIFRGHIDSVMQFADKRDMLCPYLLSMAPCVSLKYWKDVMQLYLAQMERLHAKGLEEKLYVRREYGGRAYRACCGRLALQEPRVARDALVAAGLHPEAYLLCRLRFMDSLAEETLAQWAQAARRAGNKAMAALCYIVLDDLAQAASILATSTDEECLLLAADCAKLSGQSTLANNLIEKSFKAKSQINDTKDHLKELPTRMELLMKECEDTVCDKSKVELDENVDIGDVVEVNGSNGVC